MMSCSCDTALCLDHPRPSSILHAGAAKIGYCSRFTDHFLVQQDEEVAEERREAEALGEVEEIVAVDEEDSGAVAVDVGPLVAGAVVVAVVVVAVGAVADAAVPEVEGVEGEEE
jgi:hypothetical protein